MAERGMYKEIFRERNGRFNVFCEDEMTDVSSNMKSSWGVNTFSHEDGNRSPITGIYVRENNGRSLFTSFISPTVYADDSEGIEIEILWGHDIDGGFSAGDVSIPFPSSENVEDCIDAIAESEDIRSFFGSAERIFLENVHSYMLGVAANITELWRQDAQISDLLSSSVPEDLWEDDNFSGLFIPSGEYGSRLLELAKDTLKHPLNRIEVDFNRLRGKDWVLMMVSSESSNVLPVFNYNVTPLAFRFESEDDYDGKVLSFIVWERNSSEDRYQTITAEEIDEYLEETR